MRPAKKTTGQKPAYLRQKQSFVRRLCRVAIKEGIVGARWESGTRIGGATRG